MSTAIQGDRCSFTCWPLAQAALEGDLAGKVAVLASDPKNGLARTRVHGPGFPARHTRATPSTASEVGSGTSTGVSSRPVRRIVLRDW